MKRFLENFARLRAGYFEFLISNFEFSAYSMVA
jgi:hypothetical protein